MQRNQAQLVEAHTNPNLRVDGAKLNVRLVLSRVSSCQPFVIFDFVQTEIDDIVSQDCPQCGEMAIRAIEEPFIPDVSNSCCTCAGGQLVLALSVDLLLFPNTPNSLSTVL